MHANTNFQVARCLGQPASFFAALIRIVPSIDAVYADFVTLARQLLQQGPFIPHIVERRSFLAERAVTFVAGPVFKWNEEIRRLQIALE